MASQLPLHRVRRDSAKPLKQDCGMPSGLINPIVMTRHPSYDDVMPLMKELLKGAECHRTLAIIREVCIKYLRGSCYHPRHCRRKHPVNKRPFLEILDKQLEGTPTIDSARVRLATCPGSEPIESLQSNALFEIPNKPTVNLPMMECFNESFTRGLCIRNTLLDDDMSASSVRPSWDSETGCWISSCDSPSWMGESSDSSPDEGPTRESETRDLGKSTADEWLEQGSSSGTASVKKFSTPYARLSQSHDLRGASPAQSVEKCESWLHNLPDSYKKTDSNDNMAMRRRHRRYSAICRRWLRGQCDQGYACKFAHGDLEYEWEEDRDQRPTPAWSTTVHEYAKVKLSAGFYVEGITTGFETSFVLLHGIPSQMGTDKLLQLLQPIRNISEIRMSERSLHPTKTAKIHFSKPEDAQSALPGLKRLAPSGMELSVQMPISTSNLNAVFKDSMVVVELQPPGKTWYAGYPNATDAQKAIAQCRAMAWESPVDAQIHTGLPAVGPVTVKFRGLPASFEEQDIKQFVNPSSVLCERTKYTNLVRATGIIKSILERYGKVLSFRVHQSTSKVTTYAQFSSTTEANAACAHLDGMTPPFTGKTRIYAHHDRTVEYRLSAETFSRAASDIEALKEHVWKRYRHDASINISGRSPIIVELRTRILGILGKIKQEFEKTLSGEVIKSNGKIIWDDFFAQPSGFEYLQELQVQNSRVVIRDESATRKIRLFGPPQEREEIARRIIDKVLELRAQQISFIPLAGHFIGIFMSKEVLDLQRALGPEIVSLDIANRRLRIRGDESTHRTAVDLVHKVRSRYHERRLRGNNDLCPVCLDEPTQSVRLRCGHRWCSACLTSYLVSAISSKAFPLNCLGNEARCDVRIPLSVASDLLAAEQFQAVAEAAFSSHVQSHSDEFHYCPSPDCPQVYRAKQKSLTGTTVQCPSCLLRICAACHQEAHEGFTCADDDSWNEEMQEWAKDHDVKRCPGCRITIERIEGCNHMTCTNCQTHICWVCMKTFPKGEGIYGHMREEHGDFGLGPIM